MKQTLRMTRAKDCKHSVVYEAPSDDPNPAVRSVYVARTFASPMPQTITVTISDEEGSTGTCA